MDEYEQLLTQGWHEADAWTKEEDRDDFYISAEQLPLTWARVNLPEDIRFRYSVVLWAPTKETDVIQSVTDVVQRLAEDTERNLHRQLEELGWTPTPQGYFDGPTNRAAPTGSQRDSRLGKGRFDLLPPTVETLFAQALEKGADKYEERNWEKGQPLSWYYDSGRRHLTQWWEGQQDEDHLLSACVNLMMALHTREMIRRGNLPESLDDTPDYTAQGHEGNQPAGR